MIITVTMNPAIDKTAEVETLHVKGLNRLCHVRMDAGGKGVNVSKTIQALGGTSICTGFLAGSAGDFIEQALHNLQIETSFIRIEGNTRTNLKVLDKDMELTELNEAGPIVNEKAMHTFMEHMLGLCHSGDIVVLSGNVSPGVDASIYYEMITQLKKNDIRVLLDADGVLFQKGVVAKPAIIKPNKYELATYFNIAEHGNDQELLKRARTLLNDDTTFVVVSMGKEGAFFLTKDQTYHCDALSIEAHSSVGAGDAMVAAIAYALEEEQSIEELMTLAIACSAGAVMTKGTKPADKDVIMELKKQVVIKPLEDK